WLAARRAPGTCGCREPQGSSVTFPVVVNLLGQGAVTVRALGHHDSDLLASVGLRFELRKRLAVQITRSVARFRFDGGHGADGDSGEDQGCDQFLHCIAGVLFFEKKKAPAPAEPMRSLPF